MHQALYHLASIHARHVQSSGELLGRLDRLCPSYSREARESVAAAVWAERAACDSFEHVGSIARRVLCLARVRQPSPST